MWLAVLVFSGMVMLASRSSASASKTLTGINWMHVPKASSWIGDFLMLFACPHLTPEFEATGQEEFFYELVKDNKTVLSKCEHKIINGRDGSFGWHDPFIPEITNGTTVALFRKPRSRLLSAYLFGERGMMIPPGHLHALNETYHLEIFAAIQNTTYPIITYSQYLGIPSCQTKMVLGHYCGTEVPISDADLIEAKRRVEHDFSFVGLTEEPEASSRLFYAMYGNGRSMPATQPHLKLYRANANHPKATRAKLIDVLREQKWSDPPEQALYQHVRKIFYQRCAKYSIPTLEHPDVHNHE